MMGRALSSDFLKIRGKGLWFLVFLAPLGLIAMQALNFGLRYDYMTKTYAGKLWETLLENIQMFVPLSLFLGITLIASLLANVEHSTSAWKQLLALPVSRSTVFSAKFTLCVILLAISCALLAIGTTVLGLSLKFGSDIPFLDIIKLCFMPFLAAFPALALMLWLCLTIKNQAMPVTMGIVAAMTSLFSGNLSEFFPLNWPTFAYTGPHEWMFVGGSLLLGTVILLMGLIHFNGKDVS